MTLEASILLPLFMLFVLNLYTVIDMLRLQAIATWHLHRLGDKICAYGYLPQTLLSGDEQDSWLDIALDLGTTFLYVRNQMEELVSFPDKVYVTTASILEEGKVELSLTYNYPLFGPVGKRKEVWLQSSYFGYAWGDAKTVGETEGAFVTSNGEVYHLYMDCTHLKLTILELPEKELDDFSKEHGKVLVPCLKCAQKKEDDMVYITLEQERIHYEKACAGLTRNISLKDLETAMEEYEVCKRCEERKK
jgi:hypothetical protein